MNRPASGAGVSAARRQVSLGALLREIARYLCGSPHSRWRQRAQFAELDRRLRNDIGRPHGGAAGEPRRPPPV